MVCLDTAFFADLFRKNSDAEKRLVDLMNEKRTLSTTIITIAELYYGAYKSKNVEEEKKKVAYVFEIFSVLEMDARGAEKFGEILYTLEKTGQRVHDRDVLIGAIAISSGENTIVTRNAKDLSRIPGLTVLTY